MRFNEKLGEAMSKKTYKSFDESFRINGQTTESLK